MLVCAAAVALGATAHGAGSGTTSVNVSEDAGAYTVEVRGPDLDATSVRWTGGRLEIRREGGSRASQQIEMPEAGPGAALTLRRAGDALVVRVEKGGDTTASTATRQPGDVLRDQMLSQFATMGTHVAKMMDQALAEQGLDGFFEESGLLPKSQPASRFELKDAGRTFVLTAPMTEEEAKTVKIAVENDQLLKITSKSESQSGGPATAMFQSASATQAVTLPQPVKADEVSMNYKDGKLEIVIPKA